MRVLVACEYSGVVRDAFAERGHEAWSCDTASGQNKLGPSPDRWKIRSATYPGFAKAMADQWGAGWNL